MFVCFFNPGNNLSSALTINTFHSFQYSDDALLTLDGGHEMPSAAAATCQGGRARLTLAAQCVTRSVLRRPQPLAVWLCFHTSIIK